MRRAQAQGKKSCPTERHCEPFTPDGARLVIPDGIRELEVRTPGSAGLGLEWTGGTVTVEMKRFSVLLKLRFPALEVGEPCANRCGTLCCWPNRGTRAGRVASKKEWPWRRLARAPVSTQRSY